MFLGEVIGNVVATRKYPSLEGGKMLVVQTIAHDGTAVGRPLIAVDTTQAGPGDRVYLVKSREATLAWHDPMCPIDAAIVGIVDRIQVEETAGT